MKNNKKKAFTLVELLVVIAILAILASVTVVGYVGFTEKANKSVDEQMCTQYNNLIKAENVENPDLSLKDITLLIELNGIRSDQLLTKSKAYEFVFDRANQTLALMNKETGDIEFPENYEAKGPLWTVLREDLKFPQGINHAEMLFSFETNSVFEAPTSVAKEALRKNAPSTNPAYVINMNNCTLRLSNPKALDAIPEANKVEIKSGTLLSESSTTTEKVQAAPQEEGKPQTQTNIIDTSSKETPEWGYILNSSDLTKPEDKKGDSDMQKFLNSITSSLKSTAINTLNTKFNELLTSEGSDTYVIKDKYFSAPKGEALAYSPLWSINCAKLKEGKTIIVENCSFENLAINFSGFEGKLIIRNCKFFNCLNWTLALSGKGKDGTRLEYEIIDNEFINCGGGINISLPYGATSTSKIDDNYFDLMDDKIVENIKLPSENIMPLVKQKFMEKNNAIQLVRPASTYLNETKPAIGNLEINNNKVLRATSLIILHNSLVGKEHPDEALYSDEDIALINSVFAGMTISNNDLRKDVLNKVLVDPDSKATSIVGNLDFNSKLEGLKTTLLSRFK